MSERRLVRLPKEWSSERLDACATVIMGQSPPSSSYNERGVGFPFFQGKKEFGSVHPTVEKWTTEGSRFALPGDILVSVRAPVGPTNVADIECVIGRGLAAIRSNDKLDQKFLHSTLRALEADLASRGTGTTFDSISKESLRSIPVPIPPIEEQRRIVEILDEQLSRLDAALESVRVVREKAAQFRRSLLNVAFSGELTGPDLATWRLTTLNDVATLVNGRAYSKDELLDSGKYRVLRVGNFFSSNSWYWSDLELEESKYCDFGDLLYAWSASFGPRIWEGEKVIFHYHIWKVVEDPTLADRTWLKHWLDNDVERIKAAVGTGTTMMHVTKREMEKREIQVPSIETQRAIVAELELQLSKVESALESVNLIERRIAELRRSLLHSAFTGELTASWRASR